MGVCEWLRYKLGEPMLYAGRLTQMPLEQYRIYQYCLRTEKAAKEGDASLNKLLALHQQLDEMHGLR
jgi:hypothetical protein